MRVLVLAGCMLCATTQAVNEPLELNAPDVMEWEVGHALHSSWRLRFIEPAHTVSAK